MKAWISALAIYTCAIGGAQAQEAFAYVCASPSGQAWYFPNELDPGNAERFVPDGIREGRMLIIVGEGSGPGGADVRYRDASGSFRSAMSEGGSVRFTHFDDHADIARIDATYEATGTSETFLLYGFRADNVRLVYTQIRPMSALPKVAVFVARCERF